MPSFLKYLADGMRKSMIVGVPDFTVNNQYTDIQNIGNDFNIAIESVVPNNEKRKPCFGNRYGSSTRRRPKKRGSAIS